MLLILSDFVLSWTAECVISCVHMHVHVFRVCVFRVCGVRVCGVWRAERSDTPGKVLRYTRDIKYGFTYYIFRGA